MISEHKSHDYGHDIMFHISVDPPGHAPSQQGKDWHRCPTDTEVRVLQVLEVEQAACRNHKSDGCHWREAVEGARLG